MLKKQALWRPACARCSRDGASDRPRLVDGRLDEARTADAGAGSNGLDFSSGWNCTPMNQGWSGDLDDLRQLSSSGDMPENAARLLEPVAVVDVDLVAVAVALAIVAAP